MTFTCILCKAAALQPQPLTLMLSPALFLILPPTQRCMHRAQVYQEGNRDARQVLHHQHLGLFPGRASRGESKEWERIACLLNSLQLLRRPFPPCLTSSKLHSSTHWRIHVGIFFFLDLKRERSSLVWSLRIRMQRAPCSPWRVLAPERSCSLPHKALSAGWINIGHQERPSTGLQMMFFTKEPRWEATWLAAWFAIQAAHCDICGDGQSTFTGKRERVLCAPAWSPRVLQVSTWIFSISELLGLRTQCCPLALSFRES